MTPLNIEQIDFQKSGGLVPAVIQDARTRAVLMVGYMNRAALEQTVATKKVTFFSRSKERLWVKGETSGHFLEFIDARADCDQDTLLIEARPSGPVCHTGADTCFGTPNPVADPDENFLRRLEGVIRQRKNEDPAVSTSYTNSLFQKGINKIAQKVGEEAVELVIEAKDNDRDLFLGEAADLMFHYLILLQAKGYELDDVISVLRNRHK